MSKGKQENESKAPAAGSALPPEAVMELAVAEWVYSAAMGEPVADFAESFGPVRDVLDHRSVLTGLIGNLCEIVEAFARPSDQSAWTQGVLEEAHEVLLKESRAAFGRSGPCAPPVVLDGEPQVNPAEPAPTALESLPKTAAQGEEK